MDIRRPRLLSSLMSVFILASGIANLVAARGVDAQPQSAAGDVTELPEAAHCHTEKTSKSRYQRSTAPYRVPDVPLVSRDGALASAGDVLNHPGPVMFNFIFTTCSTVCPVLSATFESVRKQLGAEAANIRFASITVDPEQDNPAALRRYAEKYHADAGWGFFTGRREDIVVLQRAFDSYRGNKMNHRPVTFLRAHADGPWLRLEGFPAARDVVNEYRALARGTTVAGAAD